jgi:hypothetical protein
MVVVRGEQSSSTQLRGQIGVGLSWAEHERVWRQYSWPCEESCRHVSSCLLLPLEGPEGLE